MKPALPTLFSFIIYSTLFVSSLSDVSENDLNDFWEWCLRRGLVKSDGGISLQLYKSDSSNVGHRIGVISSKDIEMAEYLITVDKKNQVSSEYLLSLPEKPFPNPSEAVQSWLPHLTVAAWILKEKKLGKSSEWEPYLRILPKKFTLPLVLAPVLLHELQDDEIYDEVESENYFVQSAFESLDPNYVGNITLEDFKWALAVVISRSFNDENVGSNHLSLIPLADMLNHQIPANISWTYKEGIFTMESRTWIPAGSQIFNSYGLHGNAELLLHYGFSLSQNPYEGVKIFKDLDSVIRFYSSHLAQFPVRNENTKDYQGKTEYEWLKYVAETAVLEVGEVDAKRMLPEVSQSLSGPEWNYEEGLGFKVWAGGRVEPRLLAALAAMAYFDKTREAPPDFSVFADASIRLGRDEPRCHHLEAFKDNIKSGLVEAVIGVYYKIQELLKEFHTTLQEDTQILEECGAPSSQLPESCSSLWSTNFEEMSMFVNYRLLRKTLLESTLLRFSSECEDYLRQASTIAKYTGYVEAIEKDIHDEL